jgi:hypothetical protein
MQQLELLNRRLAVKIAFCMALEEEGRVLGGLRRHRLGRMNSASLSFLPFSFFSVATNYSTRAFSLLPLTSRALFFLYIVLLF